MHLPMYSKEAATIAKIYTDFYTNRILTGELVTACQGVPVCRIAASALPLETTPTLPGPPTPLLAAPPI
jgi:hypothetical protein